MTVLPTHRFLRHHVLVATFGRVSWRKSSLLFRKMRLMNAYNLYGVELSVLVCRNTFKIAYFYDKFFVLCISFEMVVARWDTCS